jgi:hypothetical protein
MGVNISYWLMYGVNIHDKYRSYEMDDGEKLYETFEQNNMVANYYSKFEDIKNRNVILIGENHTIFGKVLKFCREEDGLYGLVGNKYVIPISEIAEHLEKEVNEEMFISIRKDLNHYFEIDNKVPELLLIYHHS